MGISPQKNREMLFLALFSLSFSTEGEELEALISEQLKVSKVNARRAISDAKKIFNSIPLLDEKITRYSTDYRIERIPAAEKTILRIALYELFFLTDLPPKVALSEAIRLAKKFAGASAATFVNALLDKIYKEEIAQVEQPESTREHTLSQV